MVRLGRLRMTPLMVGTFLPLIRSTRNKASGWLLHAFGLVDQLAKLQRKAFIPLRCLVSGNLKCH